LLRDLYLVLEKPYFLRYMTRFSPELSLRDMRAVGSATGAIAAILFLIFDVSTTNAQESEPEELQPSISPSPTPPPSSSPPLLLDDILSDNGEESVLNSTRALDASDRTTNIPPTMTDFLDKSASGSQLSLRWSNITEVPARTLHIFDTKCQPNEIPLSGTWIVGSAQYLSVIANYPSIQQESEENNIENNNNNNNLSWIVIIFNSHQSNSFPASAGVLCQATTTANSSNATTAVIEPPTSGQNQQQTEARQQSETVNPEVPLPQVLESNGGGMTATLNDVSFTTGEIIAVNGSVEERGPESFVTIEVLDPENMIVESAIVDINPENRFMHSFLAGVQEDFDFDDPMDVSGNYKMIVRYIAPDFDTEVIEYIIEYIANTTTSLELEDGGGEVPDSTEELLTEYALEGYNDSVDDVDNNNTGQVSTSARVSIAPGSTDLTNIAYQPNPAQIRVGDKITWSNNDLEPHTVTSGENAQADGRFDSGIMAPTRTFEHTFTQPGQYPYFCILHPSMVGIVRVLG
jgi:plastocyanin